MEPRLRVHAHRSYARWRELYNLLRQAERLLEANARLDAHAIRDFEGGLYDPQTEERMQIRADLMEQRINRLVERYGTVLDRLTAERLSHALRARILNAA